MDEFKTKIKPILFFFIIIIILIELKIFDQDLGMILLIYYSLMAMLFVLGRIRLLILGFALLVTALVFFLMIAGEELGIINSQNNSVIFMLWSIILLMFMELIYVSGIKNMEKLQLYKKYIYMNMYQVFIMIISLTVIFTAPLLRSGSIHSDRFVLNILTVIFALFAISAVLFFLFLVNNFFSGKFLEDFVQAISGLKEDSEYDDARKRKLKSQEEYGHIKAFKQIRFVTLLLFISSFITIYIVFQSKIMQDYLHISAQSSHFMKKVVYLVNYGELSSIFKFWLKILFFILDVIILNQIYQYLSRPVSNEIIKSVTGIDLAKTGDRVRKFLKSDKDTSDN